MTTPVRHIHSIAIVLYRFYKYPVIVVTWRNASISPSHLEMLTKSTTPLPCPQTHANYFAAATVQPAPFFLVLPGKKRAFALRENAYKHLIRTREPLFPNDKSSPTIIPSKNDQQCRRWYKVETEYITQ